MSSVSSCKLLEAQRFLEKQAVSLARRMAGKKGAVVQLQAEINTEDDWDKLLTRDGLIVVDVYSDWCGPCVGMVGNLKKCKLEMGGDLLHLAIAKSDEIEVLKRFRNKSEPTWMFISGGQLLHVMFGANAPRLMQLIETELKNENKVKSGELTRETYQFDELTPEEVKRAEAMAARRAEEARLAAARELAAKNEERDRRYSQMMNDLLTETVVLLLPQTLETGDMSVVEMVEAALNPIGIVVTENCKLQVTPDIWEEITYRETLSAANYLGCIEDGQCYGLLVKCSQSPPIGVQLPEELGDVERLVWETINMAKIEEGKIPTAHPESIAGKFLWTHKSDKVDSSENVDKVVKKKNHNKNGKETSRKNIKNTSMTTKPQENSKNSSKNENDETTKNDSDGSDAEIEKDVDELPPVPAVFTPISYFCKCAAVASIFPARAQKIAVAEHKPPRLILVFDPAKADECYALAEDLKEEVTNIGFFSSADLEETLLIARTREQYSKVAHAPDNRLIVAVANTASEPTLEFTALGPLYVSPNDVVGTAEADKLFPNDIDLSEADDDDEHGRPIDGGMTPTTAVTAK